MKIRLFATMATALLAVDVASAIGWLNLKDKEISYFNEAYYELNSQSMKEQALRAQDTLLTELFATLDKKSSSQKQIDDGLRDFLL